MKTVFVDVDTQLDFLVPSGALYVPGAERIIPMLEHLNRYAAARGIPVLSTTDAHAEDDPEFAGWPPHCVAGTIGQHKPAVTLLEKRTVVPNRDAVVKLDGAEQIVLEKQTLDAFETKSIQHVLDWLAADRFVVYGVVTEVCVLHAVRGFASLGKEVVVVEDAIQAFDRRKGDAALARIRAFGARVVRSGEV